MKLREYGVSEYGLLPDELNLSDSAVATMINCALDLEEDDLVDSVFVKRFRQSQREKNGMDQTEDRDVLE